MADSCTICDKFSSISVHITSTSQKQENSNNIFPCRCTILKSYFFCTFGTAFNRKLVKLLSTTIPQKYHNILKPSSSSKKCDIILILFPQHYCSYFYNTSTLLCGVFLPFLLCYKCRLSKLFITHSILQLWTITYNDLQPSLTIFSNTQLSTAF